MANPPPYDSDFNSILVTLASLDLGTSHPLHGPPSPPRQGLYRYDSPTKSGLTPHWDEAADATQCVPGGHSSRVEPKPASPGRRKGGYAVFYGRVPGYYRTWAEVHPLVDGVQGCLYQGYPTLSAARAAFLYAQERSWTRRVDSRPPSPNGTSGQAPIRQLPQPSGFNAHPNALHTGSGAASRGKRWYVVYRGINPGVYDSYLECGLNTIGLRGATHDSWTDKLVAVAKYQQALQGGRVRVLNHPY